MGNCQHRKNRCIDSRPKQGYRIRRYKCSDCGYRHSTAEVVIDKIKWGSHDSVLTSLRESLGVYSKDQITAIENLKAAFKS